MAVLLSSTDLAIGLAVKAGSLKLVERASRFGGSFFAIEDDCGVIEVATDLASAEARVAGVAR